MLVLCGKIGGLVVLLVNSGLTASDVYSLAVSGTNLLAGTSAGVYRSTNNGTSWTVANTTLTSVSAFTVSGINLFAAQGSGVFHSTDNGTSWSQVSSPWFGNTVAALGANGTYLFVGTSGFGGFRSTDNGTTWTPMNPPSTTSSEVSALAASGNCARRAPAGADASPIFGFAQITRHCFESRRVVCA